MTPQKHNESSELIVLGDQPVSIKCPYCLNKTITNVTYKNGYLSFLSSLFVLLAFGLLVSLFLIPAVMLVTKSLRHRCAVCGEELGSDGLILYSIGIKDRMVSFKFGEMGCILTKKIMIGILLMIITLALLAYRINQVKDYQSYNIRYNDQPGTSFNNSGIGEVINDSWIDFKEKCSRDKYLLQEESREFCQRTYQDKTIKGWKGYVIRIDDYRSSLLKYLHHAVTIIVKMEPPESILTPDIMLTLDSGSADKLGQVIEQLNRGSEFSFDATIKSLGDLQSMKHFHLLGIKMEDGFKEISPHLHQHGRYGSDGFLKQSGQ